MQNNAFDCLIGKVVEKIFLDKEEQHWIVIVASGVPYKFQTVGDCCSETWFAEIYGVAEVNGGKVLSVEDLNLVGYNIDDGRCRQESDEVYGHLIKTNKGDLKIIYRNSSNGYYNGYCEDGEEQINDDFDGLLTEDYSA